MLLRAGAGIVLLGAIVACDSTPDYLRRQLQEKRLADAGLESVDPSGEASAAGMSILKELDIPPIRPRRIGADTASPGFHRYVHRCGTCHVTPEPALKSSGEWRAAVSRMEKHMREAGLIPLGPTDRDLILRFLSRHGAGTQ